MMPKTNMVILFITLFVLISLSHHQAAQASPQLINAKVPDSKEFWDLPLISDIKKMTRLPMDGDTIPFVGYKTCKSNVKCAEIYQKSWTAPCIARTRNLVLDQSKNQVIEYKEQWMGECKAYFDHPKVSEIFKAGALAPSKISIDSSGIATGFWLIDKESLHIKAWCEKNNRRLRDCRIIELTALSQVTHPDLPGRSIPW